jgi:hypothetical protein
LTALKLSHDHGQVQRRRFVKLLTAALASVAARPLVDRGSVSSAHGIKRPRFYLQIIPQGGMDAVYTTDPKLASEVDDGIDVPFGASEIVQAQGVRLGPGFRALSPWLPRLAIVNAFRQNSANHVSGLAHVTRCKSTVTPNTPSLVEILGARRDREATGAIHIGAVEIGAAFSPRYLGEPGTYIFGSRPGLFEHLDEQEPDDLRDAAKALRNEAAKLGGRRASATERSTAKNLLEAAELFNRVAEVPKFRPLEWSHDLESDYHNGRDLQRVMWLFENSLTRCVCLCVGEEAFDTHLANSPMQGALTAYLAFLLDKLFQELDSRIVDGRPLSEQTIVMIGSEIGRFPRLNVAGGKDHFPQTPHLFYGAEIATGASFGGTGRNMASLPVSLATGKPERGGHLLRVDDIGTTLLTLDGANPELYGYDGQLLGFLTKS